MRYRRRIVKFIINHFFSCTRFWELKRKLLTWAGVKIGNNSKVVGPIEFGNVISIEIGTECWIGKGICFEGNGKVVIGNNVDIAPYVCLETGGHLIGENKRRAGKGVVNKIIIGDGCWIGCRSTVINTVEICSGSVIAAGSLVNHNVPDNVLVAGVPAKLKKKLEQ